MPPSSLSSPPQRLVPEEALPVKRPELVQLQLGSTSLGCIPVWSGAGREEFEMQARGEDEKNSSLSKEEKKDRGREGRKEVA